MTVDISRPVHSVAWLECFSEPDLACHSQERWARWRAQEPDLEAVASLADVGRLRGRAADPPLGALVRLAARDGGDDPVAAAAVVSLLQPGVRCLCRRLRDLSDDIEPIVAGELWAQVRTFPWRRRTHAYAANLLLDTRAGVLRHLQVGRWAEPLVLVGDDVDRLEGPSGLPLVDKAAGAGEETSARELAELVAWARARRVMSAEDEDLISELVEAGRQVMPLESGWSKKGVCSELALSLVAQRRGVSTKTLVRHRNRVVAALRRGVQLYLDEVA